MFGVQKLDKAAERIIFKGVINVAVICSQKTQIVFFRRYNVQKMLSVSNVLDRLQICLVESNYIRIDIYWNSSDLLTCDYNLPVLATLLLY
jgi:hypothetical protein